MTLLTYGRDIVLDRLRQDLIGPDKENEILESRPSDVYLTGILWPANSRFGGDEDEKLGLGGISGDNGDSSDAEDDAFLSGMSKPATAGLSFATFSETTPIVKVRFSFALYQPGAPEEEDKNDKSGSTRPGKNRIIWVRKSFSDSIVVPLEYGVQRIPLSTLHEGIPEGVFLHARVICQDQESNGARRLATITLVNDAKPDPSLQWLARESCTLFQVELKISPCEGTELIARPSGRKNAIVSDDEDERSAALLYRNAREYATGHTCSATWDADAVGEKARWIATTWIPDVIVRATSPLGHELFSKAREEGELRPLSAGWLSEASDDKLKQALLLIPEIYEEWLALQEAKVAGLEDAYRKQAQENLGRCREVLRRMAEGAEKIGSNHDMADAFRLANRAILTQYEWNPKNKDKGPFVWRPFQIGFILLTIPSTAEATHPDRDVMDLLWFPTGGGKTEAYLALVAFTIFYRRLSAEGNPDSGAGVVAIMRYTLRLLTTQQFARASAVILACEMIRRGRDEKISRALSARLGNKPVSIGLWVGGEATPNDFETARRSLEPNDAYPSPKQLEKCPACGQKLEWNADQMTERVNVFCQNTECVLFNGNNTPLPVYTVDSDIYRECPSLIVGTVDKFAQIVRRKEIKSLFSVNGPNPPDLIVQDELHLISGPLGTIAGLYETAIDWMFSKGELRPKVIGSTATIRRAAEQIKALFNRDTCQFPPPAIDQEDSGFAVIDRDAAGRMYAAVSTAGRSAKFTLQAVSASLLQSGRGLDETTDIDYYWTILSYFNSLRELGGALVLMQDDVNDSLYLLARRRNEEARRNREPEELTSRRTQEEIRLMLEKLEIPWNKPGALDTVLATNMVSVGVDISRLGLMLVNGQPKSISEYIQATSRVGRGKVPGLVVTILNNAKPRDRSHYESFSTWHRTLYRDVEATSVTPFAPRAREKALHAVLVALLRHTVPGMMEVPDIGKLSEDEISAVTDYIIKRARMVDPEESNVASELKERIDNWKFREPDAYYAYGRGGNDKRPLLQDAENAASMRARGFNPGDPWSTMNNMRSVEPSTAFQITERLKPRNQQGGASD